MNLDFGMFGKNANKLLPLELQIIELKEINKILNEGTNIYFDKF